MASNSVVSASSEAARLLKFQILLDGEKNELRPLVAGNRHGAFGHVGDYFAELVFEIARGNGPESG
jgi:hypothetical protein